jgi:hypothetical protein
MKRVRLVLVLGFLALVVVVGAFQVHRDMTGPGQAVVIAPAGHTVEVVVDGAPAVKVPGAYKRFELPQGVHTFALADLTAGTTATRTFELNSGKSHKLVSVSDDQCFVVLDIALSHYSISKSDEKPPLPFVHERFKNVAKPFELYTGYYLEPNQLPQTVPGDAPVYLLHEISCARVGGPDAQLLSDLGY